MTAMVTDALMQPGTALLDGLELLTVALRRPAWHAQAACRGVGTEAFYPGRGEPVSAAVAICARCTVRAQCTEASRGELHGIWAGMSGRERRTARMAARG